MEITYLDTADDDAAADVADISGDSDSDERGEDEYVDMDKIAAEDETYTENIDVDRKPETSPDAENVRVLKELSDGLRQSNEQHRAQMQQIMEHLAQQRQQAEPEPESEYPEVSEEDWITDPSLATRTLVSKELAQFEKQKAEEQQRQYEEQQRAEQIRRAQADSAQHAVRFVPELNNRESEIYQLTDNILQNMNDGNALFFAACAAKFLKGGVMPSSQGQAEMQEKARTQERTRMDRVAKNPPAASGRKTDGKPKFSAEEKEMMVMTGIWGDQDAMNEYSKIKGYI